jgi:hypothetical protein
VNCGLALKFVSFLFLPNPKLNASQLLDSTIDHRNYGPPGLIPRHSVFTLRTVLRV